MWNEKYFGHDEQGKFRYNYKASRVGGVATPKMKLIGDLKALGLKDADVHAAVKKPGSKACQQAISPFKKDRLVKERTNSEIEAMVGKAKAIIQRASLQAALNYEDAVNDGDLKASGKVLDLCGAFTKATDVNVNIGFGKWLKGVQDRDEILTTVEEIQDIPTQISNLKDESLHSRDSSPIGGQTLRQDQAPLGVTTLEQDAESFERQAISPSGVTTLSQASKPSQALESQDLNNCRDISSVEMWLPKTRERDKAGNGDREVPEGCARVEMRE